jgi:hypothetical protein
METCYTDNDTYVGCPGTGNGGLDSNVAVSAQSVNGYVVTATSKSTNTFIITKNTTTGVLGRTCTDTGSTKGGCPAAHSW